MIPQKVKHYTPEEFDQFVLLPENADRSFEYCDGEILEMVSNNYSSEIAAIILAEIRLYVKNKNLGRVTGADGGYKVAGARYIPDVAFISHQKQPRPSREAYNSNPPDLAVEVLSPGNDEHTMRIKISHYLDAGTTLWIVDPERQRVEVYAPGKVVQLAYSGDTLTGGDILPGFELPVKDIFPQDAES